MSIDKDKDVWPPSPTSREIDVSAYERSKDKRSIGLVACGLSIIGFLLVAGIVVSIIVNWPNKIIGGFALLGMLVFLAGLVCGILGRQSIYGKIGLSCSAFGLLLFVGRLALR